MLEGYSGIFGLALQGACGLSTPGISRSPIQCAYCQWNHHPVERIAGKRVGLQGDGTPSRTRTCDPLLRRQMLYPPELWAHIIGTQLLRVFNSSGDPSPWCDRRSGVFHELFCRLPHVLLAARRVQLNPFHTPSAARLSHVPEVNASHDRRARGRLLQSMRRNVRQFSMPARRFKACSAASKAFR